MNFLFSLLIAGENSPTNFGENTSSTLHGIKLRKMRRGKSPPAL
jgi:hypothetical protein